MDLMQKNQEDFKAFAHVLARDRDMRETYIRVSEKKQLCTLNGTLLVLALVCISSRSSHQM